MENLRIASRTYDGHVHLVLDGELEIASVEAFHKAVAEALSSPAKVVDVDLAEVSFIDSVGINALMGARKSTIDCGTEFRIVKASRHVRRVLELMGLGDYIG